MKYIISIVSVVLVLIIAGVLIGCSTTVPAGYVAVQYNLRGGIQDEVLTQGFHLVSPLIKTTNYCTSLNQSYLTQDNKGDSPKDESYSACTIEGKDVIVDLTFTYQYPAEHVTEIFTRFRGQNGTEIRDSFIKPNIVSWSKEIIAQYKVTDLLGANRATVNQRLTEYLAEKFATYNIIITNVSLINIEVDTDTANAINAKIMAQQNAETQAIQNQTAREKAQAEADVKRTNAQADADATRIRAEAEAEANALLADSLTEKVLESKKIERWDGVLPRMVSGENNDMILEIPNEN